MFCTVRHYVIAAPVQNAFAQAWTMECGMTRPQYQVYFINVRRILKPPLATARVA